MEHQERWYLDNIELEGRVIVDVGANVGRFSELFWRHGGAGCRVISIEPQPENVAHLRERIAALGAERWTVEACAVSAAAGQVRMRKMAVDYGINSVVTAGEGDELPARVLAELVPDAQVIKMDIEGHEHVVLPAAVPALARAEAWALELHMVAGHPLQDLLGLFVDHGYALHAAGRKKGAPDGEWQSVPIPRKLGWAAVPGKMLHVIAKRG